MCKGDSRCSFFTSFYWVSFILRSESESQGFGLVSLVSERGNQGDPIRTLSNPFGITGSMEYDLTTLKAVKWHELVSMNNDLQVSKVITLLGLTIADDPS